MKSIHELDALVEREQMRRRVIDSLELVRREEDHRAALASDDRRRLLRNARERARRARRARRDEREAARAVEARQLVMLPVLRTLDLEHLVNGETLAAMAAVTRRRETE